MLLCRSIFRIGVDKLATSDDDPFSRDGMATQPMIVVPTGANVIPIKGYMIRPKTT